MEQPVADQTETAPSELDKIVARINALEAENAQLKEEKEKIKANRDEILEEKKSMKAGDDQYRASISADFEAKLLKEAEERKTAQQRTQMLETHLQETVGSGALRAELAKYNLVPETMDMAVGFLSARVSVGEEDGKFVGKFDGSKSISEGVQEWAEGPTGMALRKANSQPANRQEFLSGSNQKNFFRPS